jgi:hypothetical protein
MSFRLILIHFIYRVVFGVGIAALMWVGGNLVYAKTYQFYAKPELKKHSETANTVSEMRLSESPFRRADSLQHLRISQHISDGMPVDSPDRDDFPRSLRNIRVGDEIQVSTPEGLFGYFVTTVEIVPTESRTSKSSGNTELTITTTSPFPFVGATPQRFIVHAMLQNESKN